MLSDDSETESIHTLTINEHFAKAFEYKKEREELAKLKERYGSDAEEDEEDSEDSEEAESEDEDGEELTPAMDAAILRTLARIKRKDPSIYEQGNDVFEEEKQKTGDVKLSTKLPKDKSKPLTMRQHALASALNPASRSPSPEPLTHVQEQSALRSETIAAFHIAVEDEDEDDLLVPREKTKDEIEREEEEYRAFLEREVGEDIRGLVSIDAQDEDTGAFASVEEEPVKAKKARREKGDVKKTRHEEDQEFLMNYILNRGWIDRSARRLPTYSEITSSNKGKRKVKAESDAGQDSSSEDEEDGGLMRVKTAYYMNTSSTKSLIASKARTTSVSKSHAAMIPRHPRNLPSLVRRQDTSRKDAREKRKARKEEELLQKKEEVKRLKALKMKNLRAKLERIGREGGKSLEESRALRELDLDADWDPAAHDRQMADLYVNDADAEEDEKPHWDDDIDVADIVPDEPEESKSKKKKKKKKKDVDEDAGGVDIDEMDAEVERTAVEDEEWDGTEEMRKRKLEEYMDELYSLDFNDMIGDMPTRFKYAKVDAQTFGLTPSEVLMATDAELNTYVGIKKYAPYRKEGKGKTWDAQRSSRLKELRDRLKERGVGGEDRAAGGGEKVKKRKGKKERMKEKAAGAGDATANEAGIERDVDGGDENIRVEEKMKTGR
ncbi:Protein kri1 [Grifola frondosa]|uniref:Protein kri1 n=1 Tax=Grifola frondosa TaxID=5627 RepID=A0A1C7LMR8_GRIFR|nr:Protein kri1 [Grifola frondosa]